MTYKRIAIVGNSGSGKSHLGRELHALWGHPLTYLDNLFWKPHWEKIPKEEFRALQQELIARETWIMEGNYNSTLDMRFEAADLVVFLDLSPLLCALRVLRRHGTKRPDLPEYLDEAFERELLPLLGWIVKHGKHIRNKMEELQKLYPETQLLVIRSRGALRRQLKRWREEAATCRG